MKGKAKPYTKLCAPNDRTYKSVQDLAHMLFQVLKSTFKGDVKTSLTKTKREIKNYKNKKMAGILKQ